MLLNGGCDEVRADDMVSDLLTPCLLKYQAIYTPWQVVDLYSANSVRGRARRGDLRPARAKLRKGFAVLLFVCLRPHLTIKLILLGNLSVEQRTTR